MGLLNRILHGRHHASTPADARQEAGAAGPSLPATLGLDDALVWTSQLDRATELWGDLARDLNSTPGTRSLEKLIAGGPRMAVNSRTLLKPDTGRKQQVTPRLHANLVNAGTIVMATPLRDEDHLWDKQSKDYGVGHMVRIASSTEVRNFAIEGFDPLPASAGGLGRRTAPDGQMLHWDVVAGPQEAANPRDMLNLFDKLSQSLGDPPRAVAFQSPDGDDRGAVFAAGWKLHQAVKRAEKDKRPFTEDDVADAVQEACMGIRMNRSRSLIGAPEQVASLLAMGQLMRHRASEQKGVRFNDMVKVRPYQPEPCRPDLTLPLHSPERDERAMAAHMAEGLEIQKGLEKMVARQGPLPGSRLGGPQGMLIRRAALLPPDPRLAELQGDPLAAAWAGPGTLVLSRPGPTQDMALALACMEHNIAAIIDLSTPAERQDASHAMRDGRHQLDEGNFATFDWRPGGEVELGARMANGWSRAMHVSLTLDGIPVERDVSHEPVFDQDIDSERRPLELIQVAVDPHQAIPPSQLLALARTMELYRANGTHEVIAIQCPHGDARAAALAAADAIHDQFQKGLVNRDNAFDVVADEWGRLCTEYSVDLARHPGHITSLLAMTSLMLEENEVTSRW